MSIVQIVVEFLIVAFLAWCGWRIFLLVAGLLAGINPFQKSESLESDANDDWYSETRNNPFPDGNPHKMPYGSPEQQEAIRALDEYKTRQKSIDEKAMKRRFAAGAEKGKEEVRSFGCGCLLAPVVLGVMVFGLWFSSTYPSWEDVMQLLRGW